MLYFKTQKNKACYFPNYEYFNIVQLLRNVYKAAFDAITQNAFL